MSVDVSVASLDALLGAADFFTNPYPVYDELPNRDPVHWSDVNRGWMLTRYADVAATLRDPARLSSSGRFSAALARYPDDVRSTIRPMEEHFSVGLIASDPPDHNRLRGLVNRAFTPRSVEQLKPRVEQLVTEFLDAAEPHGRIDIIRDLAFPLPATVIAQLIGVPVRAKDDFKRWTLGIMAFQGTARVDSSVLLPSQSNLLAMRAFLSDLAAERRRVPRDDLMSRLVAAEADGERLTEQELLSTCVTLMTAGHETTTNLIGNGLYTLLRHPEQFELLRTRPDLMPSAIEEMLRFESPLQRNPRRVAADLEIGGKMLREGDYVMQVLGAANRDPEQFTSPHRFDITRHPSRHVAFGYGIHFCLGAPLARMEAPIALATIFDRLPNLRLDANAVEWHRHGLLRGLTSLPVAFG